MKKKILFMINSLHGGGAEKVLQTILNNINLAEYDITLYSVNEDEPRDKYPDGITIRHIFKQKATSTIGRFFLKLTNKFKLFIYYHFSAQAFYRLFVRGIYDTEVAFIEGYATRIISGSNNKDSKKIAWVHIDLHNYHWTPIAYRNDAEEIDAYNKFSTIACVSNDTKDNLKLRFPSLNNVITIYNPIDDQAIRQHKAANQASLHNRPIRLISLGRLVHQKGYDRLLPIIKRLHAEGHNIHLTILGDGEDRLSLEQYILENKLSDVISLPGYIENPYKIMAESDIFVCSSRSEGYSTAITEALILGIAIVTTKCSGTSELLGDNEFGIITENNEEALYTGIASLISSPELIEYYKQQSAKRSSFFSLSNLIDNIKEIL